MADANTELKQMAITVANELQGRDLELRREVRDAKLHVADLESRLEISGVARERSLNFEPTLGDHLQCPDCWVRQSTAVSLRPIDSPNADDYFVCPSCNRKFVFTP